MTITGFAVVLNCNGNREVMIVTPGGCETERDVIAKAFVAARNGYPQGNIDVTELRPNQKWFVCGLPADEHNQCFWQA